MSDRQAAAPKPRAYTAVVYFHGMGSQRRFEEISRLIDCLDKYSYDHRDTTGAVAEVHADIEPPRGTCKEDVSFVKCIRLAPTAVGEPAGTRRGTDVRFYEVYWAGLTAGGVPSLQVVTWLLRQLPYPFTALLTPWRLRARLRWATLYAMRAERAGKLSSGELDEDAARLLRHYDDFEGPGAWRNFPGGTFHDFEKFLEQELKSNDQAMRERMLRLAREWRRCYVLEELGRAAILITIALTAALAAGATIWAAFKLFASFAVLRSVPLAGELLEANWTNVAAFVAGLSWLLGVNRFLRDYCGDVQVWATYEETDEKYEKRESILEVSRATLEHVLTDERCTRVVVIPQSRDHRCARHAARAWAAQPRP